jgi:hypothetical protein
MKVTAREAAIRLNVSYVVAAGLLSHLEEIGRATVVEKRFHASGKGKPTRVYEVEQNVALDFGAEDAVMPVVPVAPAAPPTLEDVVESKVEERMAAMERLKSAAVPVAEETVVPVAEETAPVEVEEDEDEDEDDWSDEDEDEDDVSSSDDDDADDDDDDDADYDAEAA